MPVLRGISRGYYSSGPEKFFEVQRLCKLPLGWAVINFTILSDYFKTPPCLVK